MGNPSTNPTSEIASGKNVERTGGIRKLWTVITLVADHVAALFLVSLAVILATGVFLRYVVHKPSGAINEVAVFLLIPATTLALAGADRRGLHIRVDFLLDSMPRRLRRVWTATVAVASAILSGWLCYVNVADGSQKRTENVHSIQVGLGLWYVSWILALAFALLAIQFVFRAIYADEDRNPKQDPVKNGDDHEDLVSKAHS